MLPTHEDTRKLVALYAALADADAHIAHIKEMLEQLSYDDCRGIRVHFEMQNKDMARRKREARDMDRLINGIVGAPCANNNFTGQPLPQQRSEGYIKSVSVFSESSGLRILSAILAEANNQRQEILMAIRDIMCNQVEVPTQALYNEHL